MSKLKHRITEALAIFGGRVTRFFNNLQAFDNHVPEGAQIAFASYGGDRLIVTYASIER